MTLPKGAARVDLSGKTVMPTLVNAHSHPGYQNSQRNYSYENYLADLNRSLSFPASDRQQGRSERRTHLRIGASWLTQTQFGRFCCPRR